MSETNAQAKAPSYNELVELTRTLSARVQTLELLSRECTPEPADIPRQQIDYRAVPDVDRSIPMFTGRESDFVADVWISSIVGVAELNRWNFIQKIQFVRAHVTDAARNWFLSEHFTEWTTFERQFRATFVCEIRLSDRWNDLNGRNQSQKNT